jgi:hypothetical protein
MISTQGEFAMTPVGSNRFIFSNRPFILRDAAVDAQFHGGSRGEPRLTLRTVWDPTEFVRVPPIDARSIRTDEYLGSFVSEELGSELEVMRGDGGLGLRAPRGEYLLEPLSADLFAALPRDTQNLEFFVAGPLVLRFHRAGGAVESLSVSRTGLPGITFSRVHGALAR